MKKLIVLISLLLCSLFSLADGRVVRSFTVAGADTGINQIGGGIAYYRVVWNVSGGTLSACSFKIDSSTDNITFNDGDIKAATTCTGNGDTGVLGPFIVNYSRLNPTTVTVGTGTPILTMTYYLCANTVCPPTGTFGVAVNTPDSIDVTARPGASFDLQLIDCQSQLVATGKHICNASGYTTPQFCNSTVQWTQPGSVIIWPNVSVTMSASLTGSSAPCLKIATGSQVTILGNKNLSKIVGTAASQFLIIVTGGGAFTAQPLASDTLDGQFPPTATLTAGNYTSVGASVGSYVKLSDQLTDQNAQLARVLTAASPTYTFEGPVYQNFRQGVGGQIARLSVLSNIEVSGLWLDCANFANSTGLKVDYVAYGNIHDIKADNCPSGGVATSNTYKLRESNIDLQNDGQSNMFITLVAATDPLINGIYTDTRGTSSFEFQAHQVHGGQIDNVIQTGANFSGRLCKFYRSSHINVNNLNCNRGGATSPSTNNGLKLERSDHHIRFTNLLAKNNYGNGILNSEGIDDITIVNSQITHNEADQISGITDFSRLLCLGTWTNATANTVCPTFGTITATMGTRSGSTNTVVMNTDAAGGLGNWCKDANDDLTGAYIMFRGWTTAANNDTWFPVASISADCLTLTITDTGAVTVAEASKVGVAAVSYRPDRRYTIADSLVGYDRAVSGRGISVSGPNWHIADTNIIDDLGLSTMGIGFVALSLGSGPQGIALPPTSGLDAHDLLISGFPANKDIDFTNSNAVDGTLNTINALDGITWTNIGVGWEFKRVWGNATDVETAPHVGTKAFAAATTATVTFTAPFRNAPVCKITPEFPAATATIAISAKSATAFTVTASAANSGTFDYDCSPGANGN